MQADEDREDNRAEQQQRDEEDYREFDAAGDRAEEDHGAPREPYEKALLAVTVENSNVSCLRL
jgi:hypothetical protein